MTHANRTGPLIERVRAKQQKRRALLDAVFTVLGNGPVPEMSDAKMCALLDDPSTGQAPYLIAMRKAGIFRSDIVYGTPSNGLSVGRHSTWTLTMTRKEAERALDSLDAQEIQTTQEHVVTARREQGMRHRESNRARAEAAQTEQTVVRRVNGDEVEAISGPDAPSPFAILAAERKDEAYAIVAAARQYAERDTKVDAKVEALLSQARDLGVHVDEAALRGSIHSDTDDRLESITLALPYIDRLERRISRLEADNVKLRTLITEHDTLNREVSALRRQNQQLIARQAAN